jgi:selenocysteine lyase/cysteine desulfurase
MSRLDDILREFRLQEQRPKGQKPLAYFAGMVLATHSKKLTKTIEDHGTGLDVGGFTHFLNNNFNQRLAATAALSTYFGVDQGFGAFTHSTTFGLAQVFAGIKLRQGQEILTSVNEHAAIMDTLRLRQGRDGTPIRQIRLFDDIAKVTEAEIVRNISRQLLPETRVLALTWVYSSDGLKLPLAKIAKVVRKENETRQIPNRIILAVDGVHGFGVERSTFPELGCDFLVAGLHKSFCGPRGTAVLCGTQAGWDAIVPIAASLSGIDDGPADQHWPGGVRAYDHYWAIDTAFQLHIDLKRSSVARHVRKLVEHFRAGLKHVPHVTLVTPASKALSSGIICLDVKANQMDLSPDQVLTVLEQRGVLATESAEDPTAKRTHVRFSISLLTTKDDVDRAVSALAEAFPVPV